MCKFGLLIGVFTLIFAGCTKDSSTIKVNFNEGWKFFLIKEGMDEKGFEAADFDDAIWSDVQLPHTANVEPLVVNDQWQGYCWYRKKFDVPTSMANKKIILELEAAMNVSKVWVNGHLVTEHYGGYLPVVADVSKFLNIGEENTFAIRLDNTDSEITGPKPLRILDFNMYGGLYRNAWLKVTNKVHISDPILANTEAGGGIFITTPIVSPNHSQVKVKTHIVNESDKNKTIELVQSVYFQNRLVANKTIESNEIMPGSDWNPVVNITVEDAKLWSPSDPNLYQLQTKVLVNGKSVDVKKTTFGIREFKFIDNKLYINGVKTYLRGVNRHQEYPFVGYALSDNAQYRDAKKIKDAGFDYVRLSHYPHSPAFMRACDELGLVVIDAILGWQYYNDTDEFRNFCYNSARNLIRRDRNHPSVLAWEVSLNETQMPIYFMEELHRIAHAEFPGENVYTCGWKPDVYDIYFQARQHRILHPIELPDKPYNVSEYGDWEYYSNNAGLNQHSLTREKRYETSSRQARAYGEARLLNQAINVQEALNDNLLTSAYGDGYWVMFDYNRGYHSDIEYSGIMDIFRLPKPAFFFFKSQRSITQDTVLHIASYWNENSPLNVKVYSNCEQVELLLNDASLGMKKPDNDENCTNLWYPPFSFNLNDFEKGELKAIGYINGEKVKEHIVKTPGVVSDIEFELDRSGKDPQSGCNDLVFLYIKVVDEKGTLVPDFSETIEMELMGDGEIMNLGEVVAEAGIATALLKIGNTAGEITVKASTQGVKTKSFLFSVE